MFLIGRVASAQSWIPVSDDGYFVTIGPAPETRLQYTSASGAGNDVCSGPTVSDIVATDITKRMAVFDDARARVYVLAGPATARAIVTFDLAAGTMTRTALSRNFDPNSSLFYDSMIQRIWVQTTESGIPMVNINPDSGAVSAPLYLPGYDVSGNPVSTPGFPVWAFDEVRQRFYGLNVYGNALFRYELRSGFSSSRSVSCISAGAAAGCTASPTTMDVDVKTGRLSLAYRGNNGSAKSGIIGLDPDTLFFVSSSPPWQWSPCAGTSPGTSAYTLAYDSFYGRPGVLIADPNCGNQYKILNASRYKSLRNWNPWPCGGAPATRDAAGLTTVYARLRPAGMATHFRITAPANLVVGTSFTMTVTAVDAQENVVSNYTGTIQIASSGAATLPTGYAFAPGDHGVYTFTAMLRETTAQTVIVTDADVGIRGFLSVSAVRTTSGWIPVSDDGYFLSIGPAPDTRLNYAPSLSTGIQPGFCTAPTGLSDIVVTDITKRMATFDDARGRVYFLAGPPAARAIVTFDLAAGTMTRTALSRNFDPNSSLFYDSTIQRIWVQTTESGIPMVTINPDTGEVGASLYLPGYDISGNPVSTPGFPVFAFDQVRQRFYGLNAFSNALFRYELKTGFTSSRSISCFTLLYGGCPAQVSTIDVDEDSGQLYGVYSGSYPAGGGYVLINPDTLATRVTGSWSCFGDHPWANSWAIAFDPVHEIAGLAVVDRYCGAYFNWNPWPCGGAPTGRDKTTGLIAVYARLRAVSAATQFRVAVPSNITVGLPFAMTITALDAQGRVVPGYAGRVHILATGPSTAPPDYTFNAGDRGVYTCSMILRDTSPQTIVVADTSSGIRGFASVAAAAAPAADIPTLSSFALTMLALALGFTAMLALRRL